MEVVRIGKETNDKTKFGDIIDKILTELREKYGVEPESKIGVYNEEDIPFDYPNESRLSSQKKYCVMFSGGCDSLSLVLRHLEKGEKVALCHVIFNPEESMAAYQIYRILKQVYGEKVLGFFKILNQIQVSAGEDTMGWSQQPITAFYATMIPRCLKEKCIAVESAYIMNDDAISYEKELKGIYNNASALKEMDVKVPYKFPLSKIKHITNLDYIGQVEKRHGVVFPCSSADGGDHPTFSTYTFKTESVTQVVHTYGCYTDSEKENKHNDVVGYIITEDPQVGKLNCQELLEAAICELSNKQHEEPKGLYAEAIIPVPEKLRKDDPES